MNAATQLLGALIEAWGEVKVQKARVVLSLVGLVAAVGEGAALDAAGFGVVGRTLGEEEPADEEPGSSEHPAREPAPRKAARSTGRRLT